MQRTVLCWALSLLIAAPLFAQKAADDPRPLRGIDHTAFPRYEAAQAVQHARPASSLLDAATPVGLAGRAAWKIGATQTLQASAPGRTEMPLRLVRAANGTVRWMQGELGRPGLPGFGKQADAHYTRAALATADGFAALLRLEDPAAELRPMEVKHDELGYVHARFEQTYAGLPVWSRDLYIHLDDEGTVYALNGTYEPTPAGVATTPLVEAGAALATVQGDLRAAGRWAPLSEAVASWLDVEAPATRLVLFPDETRGMRLAYEVTLHPNLLEWYTYLVDARDGTVLHRLARHCTLWHEGAPPKVPAVHVSAPAAPKGGKMGTFFDAAAADLNGQQQALRVYQHDDGVFYKLWDLNNFNAGQSTLPDEPAGGGLTISANETDFDDNVNLTHVTSNNNTWNDPAGVSAHVNMRVAYDYFKNVHGRAAIDGNDQSIISVIHVTDGGQSMENAFWSGRLMAYGDGGQVFKPLAGSLDVAGHEMSHGVIQHTAGLIYQFQSGALNESFADVFGVLIEPNDFLLGEDITQNAAALRDLLNPDNPQVLSAQPAHMNQFQNLNADQDNGGVHINSGIPNRAAALLIQTLGTDATADIYYRALDNYLTRNSQFGDARNALEQAATDLFGAGSNAVQAVQQAFDDVGITATTGADGEEGNDLPPQTGGASLITLLLEDGTIGLVDLTDPSAPEAFVFNDPAAVARVDAASADRAQLSTAKDGERIWFINQNRQLAFLEVETGQVSVFESLFLQEAGDLWNASISPDENFVALVSAYTEDPTLYIWNGDQIFAVPLEAETTQEGIQNQTIQYPDVITWSPNPSVPKVAFDAFHASPFGAGASIDYWGMYELDFETGTIFNLIPAQPTNLSVGNVTYSNTDPDLVAFNVIDETWTWDVVVGDLGGGETFALDLSSFTLNGAPITDGQRPTFSPDDAFLAFSTPANNALLFFDGEQLTFLDLQAATYNPRWFVRSGSGGTQNQAPTAQATASASSGPAPLLITFNGAASSDPDGDALSYRWSFGDGTVGSGASTTHTFATPGTYTVTLTVTDSGGLSGSASLPVTVEGTVVDTEPGAELPEAFALEAAYPNPFNPATTICYALPTTAEVRLTVYDLFGREVARLVEQVQGAGRYEVTFDATHLASGLYLYRIEAGSFRAARRMLLVK